MHHEIMKELRTIREQMAAPHRGANVAEAGGAMPAEAASAQALLQNLRAQVDYYENLKLELNLIRDAIDRTKQEMALLHSTSFHHTDMARASGELGAVVGGTEAATQQILEAAEAIDEAAAALSQITSADQQRLLGEEIQARVVSIFEACNFQDLTGQRINKVMTTMKFVEQHVGVMMDIWGGIESIRANAPAVDTQAAGAGLLNGPKLDGDAGHVSQDDIDAMFD
jgi:chemotaxis protein CheZ